MSRNNRCAAIAALAALAASLAGCALGEGKPAAKPELALMTSLPIYWGESAGVADALSSDEAPHWARTLLEESYQLVPLDTLSESNLASRETLLLAQPRALSPAENVALDAWVRGGGRLLLFADPMLTEHSRFHIGDRRRPQDVVLLSPILDRWGLELQFDESQLDVERELATFDGLNLPVNLAGQFALRPISPDAPAECILGPQNLVAECRIGAGRALILADAALLEQDRPRGEAVSALQVLVQRAFR